jgi:hypothetical protein
VAQLFGISNDYSIPFIGKPLVIAKEKIDELDDEKAHTLIEEIKKLLD